MDSARSYPGDTSGVTPLSPALYEAAQKLDQQYERLRLRRDAPMADSVFHPLNRGQSVAQRQKMRAAGGRLSGEYSELALEALPTDPDLAFSLLHKSLAAAPKGDAVAPPARMTPRGDGDVAGFNPASWSRSRSRGGVVAPAPDGDRAFSDRLRCFCGLSSSTKLTSLLTSGARCGEEE